MSRLSRGNKKGEREVEQSVLGYLHGHPHAADTLEGIVSWWLPQQRYEIEHERIKRVLEHLVQGGELCSYRLPDGAVLYALNHGGDASPH
ncbi:hypothetical protein [Dyella choica]|uniref:Uncharacterized protein n=1 Tax=Dyella choica TaxID=1927959 RepID=A0A432M9S4_9GAMM|nr:hypothetical protein [Dyella choica]RUL78939.1 hypothetical protein EKH80_03825 [Dyella choica]